MIKFGINSTNLCSAASAIETALNVVFQPHESDSRGGEYFRAETTYGTIFLQKNRDVLDDEPFEASWPIDQLVLFFDGLDAQAWESYSERLRSLAAPTTNELE